MNLDGEFRCHSCREISRFDRLKDLFDHFKEESSFPLKSFLFFSLRSSNFLFKDHYEEEKTDQLTNQCWKSQCEEKFSSIDLLIEHFQENHSDDWKRFSSIRNEKSMMINEDLISTSSNRFGPNSFQKCRERLISIGEDLVKHYLENLSDCSSPSNEKDDSSEDNCPFQCDFCSKRFSNVSTLKVHYEDIHCQILSSRSIQHWIYLLDKLHQTSRKSSSRKSFENKTLLKRRSTLNFPSSNFDLNRKKFRRDEKSSSGKFLFVRRFLFFRRYFIGQTSTNTNQRSTIEHFTISFRY